MIKKLMKNFFQKFYIFSKLALSISLLACLFGALYILFINYQKQQNISQKSTNNEVELQNNISKNTVLISEILERIKINETSLNNINKNFKDIEIENKDIANIYKEIKFLNENLNILSQDIQSLKKNNSAKLFDNNKAIKSNSKKNIIEIIDLILIKYENNVVFSDEIKYLSNIIDQNKIKNIEKLLILSNKKFKGFNYLKNTFDNEVNLYLKIKITKNPDSFFNKVILPYLEISPTSENNITNDLILTIKEIKKEIEIKNMENALKKLETIEDYNNIFKSSTLEIEKYLNFKKELYEIK